MRLLLHRRDFALAWLGGLVSLTGDWMLQTALPIYVYQLTGSTMATGTMLATVVTPRLLFGSVAGVLVDRWDRRRTLIVANLVLALGLLPLLLVSSVDRLWLAYVVAFGMAVVAQVVKPAEGALLPRLIGEDELAVANSLNALNVNLSRLVGPALGGLAVATTGLAGVALVDGASFVVAAVMMTLVSAEAGPPAAGAPARPPKSNPWASVWHDWIDGLRLIRSDRTLGLIVGFMAITSLGEGAMGVLFAPFVLQILGGGEVGYGGIVSAQAIGGIVGSVALASRSRAMVPARLVGRGALGLATFDLMTFNYHAFIPGVWPAMAFMALVGIPIAGMTVGITTLTQLCTGDAYRGRVLGAIGATVACSMLIGALAGGLLGDRFGVVTILNVQGLGYGVAGLLALMLLPTSPSRAPAEPPAISSGRANDVR